MHPSPLRRSFRAPPRVASLLAATSVAAVLLAGCRSDQPTAAPDAAAEARPSPDLLFAPAVIGLVPGDTARTTVRVTTGADLRGATFTLAGAPAGIAARFEAAADGGSGTLLLTTTAAPAAGGASLTVHGTGATGRSTWVGQLGVAAASLVPVTYFVSAALGSDANLGTQAKPFKTLAKALTVAKSGEIVHLGSGVYGQASGEKFTRPGQTVLVPAGVIVEGELDGPLRVSVLQGTSADIALNLAGGATVRNLDLRSFGAALKAVAGAQTLSNLLVTQSAGGFALDLSGSAQATLVGSTIALVGGAGGVQLTAKAQLTLDGSAISGGAPSCVQSAAGISLNNAGRVTLKNEAALENIAGHALVMADTTVATLTNARITRTVPAGCAAVPLVSVFEAAALTLDRSRVSGDGGVKTVGIDMNGTGAVTLDLSNLFGFTEAGILVRPGNPKLVVRNLSQIALNHIGIDARSAGVASISVTDATMVENDVGIIAASARIRNTGFGSNAEAGVMVNGARVDLGTFASPGGNTFFSVVTPGSTSVTFLAAKNGGTLTGLVNAVGNQWNHGIQGADSDGHYLARKVLNGLSAGAQGVNFTLLTATTRIQL